VTAAFAAEGKIPNSADNLYFDGKAAVEEKILMSDPDWAINKNRDVKVAALGHLFGGSKDSAAVAGNYYEWLVMQGYGDTVGRHAEMTSVDPFSTDMDCVGAVMVSTASIVKLYSEKTLAVDEILKIVASFRTTITIGNNKVTMVAAAYDDPQIKGIIAEYRADALNSLICYSVIAEINKTAYIYHFNAYGGLMEVTTEAPYEFVYGYTYNGNTYTRKYDKVNKDGTVDPGVKDAIAQDKADGTYNKKNTVQFGIVDTYPATYNTLYPSKINNNKYPPLNFKRVTPSLADQIRGIGY
jgi:hypothetical protein